MTTAITTLAERVRDLLEDYDEAVTVLAAAISTTNATTCTLERPDQVQVGSWLSIDFETVYVSEISSGPPYTATIRRGQRGSTAATHLISTPVYVDAKYPGNRVLNALNAALGKVTKIVKDDSTLTVTEDVFKYAKPSTIDTIFGVEIENSDLTGEFYAIRNWEPLDGSYFRIFGSYDTTRNIRVIGTAKFTAMATSGNLDTDFPDTNSNAINFLVYDAAGNLLLQRQARIAGRDSFIGSTDPFSQSQPDHSIRVARQYLAEAESFKRIAVSQCPILQTPSAPLRNPTRGFRVRK